MDRQNLDELRSVDALENYQTEVRGRLTELNAEYAGLPFPEDARAEYSELADIDNEITRRVRELRAREEHARQLAMSPAHREHGVPEWERECDMQARRTRDVYDLSDLRIDLLNPEASARQLRDRALAAVEKEKFPGAPDRERAQANVARLLETVDSEQGVLARRILTTGSPLYLRAWSKAVTMRPLTSEEARALSVGSDPDGGYAVPFTLDPTVILSSDGATNPIRAIARVETIVTDEWRGVTSDGVTVSRAAEAAEAGDNAPTLAQPIVKPSRVHAFVPFSYEIGMDWGALQTEITMMLRDGKDVEEATSFISGNGVAPNPQGVVAGLPAGSQVSTAVAATFSVGDLYALKGALPARFRSRAAFLAEDSIYDKIRRFDTAGGADLWVQLADGRPATLLGKPAYEASEMDATVATGKLILLYGDFRNYLIVDRVGMSVELIPHLFGANRRPTGQRGVYAFWRNSAAILVNNAFRVLKVT
jgi:HK97 family phage major capsid protein